MSDRVFLDTNVLIYFYSESEADKRQTSCKILNLNYCITSLQAMNEASNVWFRKYDWNGVKIQKHLDNIELICSEVIPIERNTLNLALSLKDRYGYSYFDCMMLASALESNCSKIITEDMCDLQVINEQLKIVNPFV